jgi:7-alpha-hydroxysteroid dehydrogenase
MILDLFRITDRVALITGAGRGIGRGIAYAFAEAGADCVIAARTREQLEETAAGVAARGRRAVPVVCDVMETASLDALVEQTKQEFPRLDILVNNAGGSPPRPALTMSEGFFERAFRFNVTQAMLLMQRCVPRMLETSGHGSIVNISSRAAGMPQAAFAAYGTAKMGLSYLTRVLGQEWAPKVRVNAIASGGVATAALEVVLTNEALVEQFKQRTPMGRVGEVEDIAAAALYLASPASAWVTGKVFEIDGGAEFPALEVPVPPL